MNLAHFSPQFKTILKVLISHHIQVSELFLATLLLVFLVLAVPDKCCLISLALLLVEERVLVSSISWRSVRMRVRMLTTWILHFTGISAEDYTLLLIGKGRKTRIWILILPTAIIPQGALPQSLRTCSPFTFITAGTGSNSSGELIWVLHSFLFPSVGCLEDVLAGVINSEALSPDSESVSTSCLPVVSCTVSTVSVL